MHHARRLVVCMFVVASVLAPLVWARPSPPTQDASDSTPAPDLSIQRELIAESNAARTAGDYDTARAMAREVVTYLIARPAAEHDAAWLALLDSAGRAANAAQDGRTANSAWKRVYEVRLATLPDEHPDLQNARQSLAQTLAAQGDLAGARAMFEKVLEVRSRTLPDEHPDLQKARQNLAVMLKGTGDLAGARALEEKVLEIRSRTLPEEHPDLQAARANLAVTIKDLGDLAGARALQERVLEVRARTLPEEHPDLQAARGNLAATLSAQGDLAGARVLFEQVLEARSRTLPEAHPDLLAARGNVALTMRAQGDLAGARTLEEKVLEICLRTLPEEHPDLQAARLNLAVTIKALGDLAGARALEEKVLGVYARTLLEGHPNLQIARQNLAETIRQLGDFAGARALCEKVVEVRSRTLPDEHPDLQTARQNLALTMRASGDLAGARDLEEKVLEVRLRTLPDEHPDLQAARANFARTIKDLGDLAGARELEEKVLEVFSRTLPDEHPHLQMARTNLAVTTKALGDLAGARALFEKVLEVNARTLPEEHPHLQNARQNLAVTLVRQLAGASRSPGGEGEGMRAREGARARCAELISDLCRAQEHAARTAILGSPAREAEERCAHIAKDLDVSISFAQGQGVLEPLHELESQVFALAETTRGAALASTELTRQATRSPRYAALRETLRAASDGLAGLAQNGATSAEFDRARVRREAVERELVALSRELSGGRASGVALDVESLAGRLAAGEATVSFLRFTKSRMEVSSEIDSTGQSAVRETSVASLCAFVVRSSKADSTGAANGGAKQPSAPAAPLTLVDLGPIEPIETAARAWRTGLGVSSDSRGVAASAREESASSVYASGALLRERIFDPLRPALVGAQRIAFVLDDALHLVPLDVLPLDENTLVGDRWQIETRTTLTELLTSCDAFENAGELVAFGDVAYGASGRVSEEANPSATSLTAADDEPRATDGEPRATSSEPLTADVTGPAAKHAGILRGSAWAQGFSPLPGTGVEVRGIAGCFVGQFGENSAPTLCEHASATRARLIDLAPKARYLHIATHGWFAPESIKSWSDPEPIDKQSGLGMRMSGEEQVKGMSPMLLCGLALAGANLPEDAVGRAPGLVTADELSTLDLSNCELAVLSACDTNVGERRAGQGVASLQKALQMAGARSVITSLWKVPDEATKELMLDFYRRMWVEKKPKWQALWEAKTKLRQAKDEHGAPKYTTRDWAAWVLTGAQD
jgi:CHAT domain-containing protein/tetratricopeptide (TPR) repeat protein